MFSLRVNNCNQIKSDSQWNLAVFTANISYLFTLASSNKIFSADRELCLNANGLFESSFLKWSELNAVNVEPKNLCLPCWLFIRLHLRFLKIFSGSPWETKRSEARPLSLQPKAFHCFSSFLEDDGGRVIIIETFRSFSEKRKKNDHSLKYLCSFRQESSRCELSCLRGYYSNMVSGSSAPRVEFGSGRLITSEVYTLVSETFAYQSPYVNLFLRFGYPQVKNQARKK